MSKFITKTENFIETFQKQIVNRYEALFRFNNLLHKVDNSVSDYIKNDSMAEEIFCALAESLKRGLCPIFSDKSPTESFAKYTRFNIWLIGATKGLDLVCVGDFMSDEKRDNDCEKCAEEDYMPAGNGGHMSTMTALYLVLQCVTLTDNFKDRIDTIKLNINALISSKSDFHQCEDGECWQRVAHDDEEEEEEEECTCYDEMMEMFTKVSKACLVMLFDLGNDSFCTDNLFQQGLGSYQVHPLSSFSAVDGVAVVRQPAEEVAEKERIAETQRLQKEKQEEYERKKLLSQVKRQEEQTEKAKKRLMELDSGKAKQKVAKK